MTERQSLGDSNPDGQLPAAAERACAICGTRATMSQYSVREMMFGLRDQFAYHQCPTCDCLQISNPPIDYAPYYPKDYYSFQRDPEQSRRGIEHKLRAMRNRYICTGTGWAGRALATIYPYRFGDLRTWLDKAGAHRDSRILDVGCGSGELLYDLALAGYSSLTGIDPYVDRDVEYEVGVRVLKRAIHEIDGTFDLIMFHHSLEHVPDQIPTIKAVRRLLANGGCCLVRVPIVTSYAWERYRENWVQLDAPRHLFLHSIKSMRMLGEHAGLRLVDVQYDSSGLQFFGSELYEQGIPLTARGERFFRRELRRSRKRAQHLNEQGRGDQAAFYFIKPVPEAR